MTSVTNSGKLKNTATELFTPPMPTTAKAQHSSPGNHFQATKKSAQSRSSSCRSSQRKSLSASGSRPPAANWSLWPCSIVGVVMAKGSKLNSYSRSSASRRYIQPGPSSHAAAVAQWLGTMSRKNFHLPEILRVNGLPEPCFIISTGTRSRSDIFVLYKTDFEVSKTFPFNLKGSGIAWAGDALRVYWAYHGVWAHLQDRPNPRRLLYWKRTSGARSSTTGGTHGDKGNWWYERWVFNIGIFPQPKLMCSLPLSR